MPGIKDIDLKRYFEIAQKVQAGLPVSEDEGRYLMEHVPQGAEEQQALNQKIEEAKKSGIVPKELNDQAAFQAARMFMQSPQYKEHMAKMIADADSGKLSERLTNAFNLALSGGDIAQSINQIQQSKTLANQSKRPGRPAPILADQNLAQALRQAQEGTYDVSKQLAPAQANIQDQYNEDLQNAKTASTGQSGAYGAYVQSAANRRNRAGLAQSALASQIMMQNRANYNDLLGLKQQENQNIFNSTAFPYTSDLHQYQLEQQTAANLGQLGRQNLRNSLANFGQSIVSGIPSYARQRKLQSLYSMMNQYGHGDNAVGAHNTLQNYVAPPSPAYDLPTTEQAYGMDANGLY